MGLHVVVGTSENAELFLRGLYETMLSYGMMDALFVDRGPGFVATDVVEVLRKLKILYIQGTAGYPQGHGKIERFNRTVKQQVLRHFDGNPEIDPHCGALELRLAHYLRKQYNLTPHESLGQQAPGACFYDDKKPLRFAQSQHHLRQAFILHTKRRVSNDNVLSLDGVFYEVIARACRLSGDGASQCARGLGGHYASGTSGAPEPCGSAQKRTAKACQVSRPG